MVETVFREEEPLGVLRVGIAASLKHDHVAAGAEAAALGMVDQHDLHDRIVEPADQRGAHHLAHLGSERVDRLWAVKPDAADAPVDGNQDVVGHWRSMSRLTITRMIWFVP